MSMPIWKRSGKCVGPHVNNIWLPLARGVTTAHRQFHELPINSSKSKELSFSRVKSRKRHSRTLITAMTVLCGQRGRRVVGAAGRTRPVCTDTPSFSERKLIEAKKHSSVAQMQEKKSSRNARDYEGSRFCSMSWAWAASTVQYSGLWRRCAASRWAIGEFACRKARNCVRNRRMTSRPRPEHHISKFSALAYTVHTTFVRMFSEGETSYE